MSSPKRAGLDLDPWHGLYRAGDHCFAYGSPGRPSTRRAGRRPHPGSPSPDIIASRPCWLARSSSWTQRSASSGSARLEERLECAALRPQPWRSRAGVAKAARWRSSSSDSSTWVTGTVASSRAVGARFADRRRPRAPVVRLRCSRRSTRPPARAPDGARCCSCGCLRPLREFKMSSLVVRRRARRCGYPCRWVVLPPWSRDVPCERVVIGPAGA